MASRRGLLRIDSNSDPQLTRILGADTSAHTHPLPHPKYGKCSSRERDSLVRDRMADESVVGTASKSSFKIL